MRMNIMVYPGSFDPFTNGHLDIARRAAQLCDRLYVVVMHNAQKNPSFTAQERIEMAKLCLADQPNILIEGDDGLLVDFVKRKGASAVVRGLRSESDFRYEAEMAAANKLLYEDYEAILMPCRIDLAFTSSSIVREVAHYGGDITGMVPAVIKDRVMARLNQKRPSSRA